MNRFKLKIVLLDGQEIEKEVSSLTCKTELGELTLLANHQPIIVIIEPGEIILDSKEKIFVNQKTILEFRNNQAKLLSLF
jgi:F0F1-type ATP synthase epsilon subunit